MIPGKSSGPPSSRTPSTSSIPISITRRKSVGTQGIPPHAECDVTAGPVQRTDLQLRQISSTAITVQPTVLPILTRSLLRPALKSIPTSAQSPQPSRSVISTSKSVPAVSHTGTIGPHTPPTTPKLPPTKLTVAQYNDKYRIPRVQLLRPISTSVSSTSTTVSNISRPQVKHGGQVGPRGSTTAQ